MLPSETLTAFLSVLSKSYETLWHPYMALWAPEIPRLYRSYIRRLTRHVKLRAPHGCDHGPRDSGFHSSAGKIILGTNFKDNSSRKRFLVTPSS